jgi:single-strand DNA-binding protein
MLIMARSLNKVQIIGNIGASPEVRTVGSGTKVAEFSIATSREWKDRDGKKQEKTEWHRIVAWGFSPDKDGLAGVASRFLHKGDRIYVEGAIEYRSYEKDGETKYITEIRASELIMLGGKDGGDSGARRSAAKTSKPAATVPDHGPEDDDLPF